MIVNDLWISISIDVFYIFNLVHFYKFQRNFYVIFNIKWTRQISYFMAHIFTTSAGIQTLAQCQYTLIQSSCLHKVDIMWLRICDNIPTFVVTDRINDKWVFKKKYLKEKNIVDNPFMQDLPLREKPVVNILSAQYFN